MGLKLVNVHPPEMCEGRGCSIHHPSGHHMATWPLNWRDDTGVMERICPHGIGHPDPDHMNYVRSLTPPHLCIEDFSEWADDGRGCIFPHLEWQGVHGCDRCCTPSTDAVTEAVS